jgi:hypothetical protein
MLKARMDPEPHRGCLMCDSLYIKANGEMPCWDDVGESRVLRKLDSIDPRRCIEQVRQTRPFHWAGGIGSGDTAVFCPRCFPAPRKDRCCLAATMRT